MRLKVALIQGLRTSIKNVYQNQMGFYRFVSVVDDKQMSGANFVKSMRFVKTNEWDAIARIGLGVCTSWDANNYSFLD